MAKAYWVVTYRAIRNPDALAEDEKVAAHDGAGYQAAVKLLGSSVERNFRIVEGTGYRWGL